MNRLSMCETARPRRPTPQAHIAEGARHPRVIWAVGESEGASQKPFDGDPYTRLAKTTSGGPHEEDQMRSRRAYGAQMCWFQGAPDLPGAVASAGVVTTEAIKVPCCT